MPDVCFFGGAGAGGGGERQKNGRNEARKNKVDGQFILCYRKKFSVALQVV